ncbi:MAG: HIRAN domain-containing protein [Ginsengibacter sp.]
MYLLQSFVAGFRFYKGMELLPHMQEQDIVELRRQPDNEHNEFAVAVYWQCIEAINKKDFYFWKNLCC